MNPAEPPILTAYQSHQTYLIHLPIESSKLEAKWSNLLLKISEASTNSQLQFIDPLRAHTWIQLQATDGSFLLSVENASSILVSNVKHVRQCLSSAKGPSILSKLFLYFLHSPDWEKLEKAIMKKFKPKTTAKKVYELIILTQKQIFTNLPLYSSFPDQVAHYRRKQIRTALPIEVGTNGDIFAILKLWGGFRPYAKGSYKKIYLAVHLHTLKLHAWGVISLKHLDQRTTSYVQHYINNEWRTIQSIGNHPNIVKTYYSIRYLSKQGFMKAGFMMELCDTDVESLINCHIDKPALPIFHNNYWNILEDILSAMNEFEMRGIHHRDIKPANFFVKDAVGGVRGKLGDFGFSVTKEQEIIQLRNCGTPLFTAPEYLDGYNKYVEGEEYIKEGNQLAASSNKYFTEALTIKDKELANLWFDYCNKENAKAMSFIQQGQSLKNEGVAAFTDPRTDIWSLGMSLYQMRTGRDPGELIVKDYEPGTTTSEMFFKDLLVLDQLDINSRFGQVQLNTLPALNLWMLTVDQKNRPNAMLCLQFVKTLRKINAPFE